MEKETTSRIAKKLEASGHWLNHWESQSAYPGFKPVNVKYEWQSLHWVSRCVKRSVRLCFRTTEFGSIVCLPFQTEWLLSMSSNLPLSIDVRLQRYAISRVRLRVTLWLKVYRQSVRVGTTSLQTQDQYFFQLHIWYYSPHVISSLTRGCVSLLVGRQRLCKLHPSILARQRLGRHVLPATSKRYNIIIVRRVCLCTSLLLLDKTW
jgi:hypothetical protein